MATKLPREFFGCIWDAHWEYDAPCVIYSPVQRYGFGGNSGHLQDMVESYCIDLAIAIDEGQPLPPTKLGKGDKEEFAWRGWSMRNMRRRKNAHHVRIKVRWFKEGNETAFEITSVKERFGPFNPRS